MMPPADGPDACVPQPMPRVIVSAPKSLMCVPMRRYVARTRPQLRQVKGRLRAPARTRCVAAQGLRSEELPLLQRRNRMAESHLGALLGIDLDPSALALRARCFPCFPGLLIDAPVSVGDIP